MLLVGKADSGMQATPEGLKGKTIGVLQGSIQETFAIPYPAAY
jgi:lysine/arginine/ornithine transport system substrate-binding protein